MNNKYYLFILLFILLALPIYGQAVRSVTFQSDTGYNVKYPLISNIKLDQDYKFHFHLFNKTNGYPITDTSCYFHLYNDMTSSHLYIVDDITTVEHNFDYAVAVSGTNFSTVGFYSYVFQCNNSGGSLIGGAIEAAFEVTATGRPEHENKNNTIPTVFLFLIIINLIAFGIPFWVEHFAPTEAGNYMVKRFIWIVAFLLLWFNTTLLKQISFVQNLNIDEYLDLYWWFFTLGTFVCIFLLTYYGVIGMIKLSKESAIKKDMGEEEEHD